MRGSFSLSLLMRGLIVMVGAALILAAGAGASPRNEKDKRSTLRMQMDALVATGVPGVVVLVRDENGTLRLASGQSNLARKTPMRVTDRFRVGSITKSFIATVVLQLVGEGKLSLDDAVDHWLPGAVPNGKTITVRQLLGHRSGLYDYLSDPRVLKPYLAGNFGYTWTPRRLVAVSASHKPLFAPGTKYSYSNTNYILLGLIVEKATGNPISAELKRRILAPLQLRSTSLDTSPRMRPPFAHGYLVQGKELQDVTTVSPSYAWTAGAIVSSADDLARFYRALLGGRLLQPELLRAMQTPKDEYGLGLARARLPQSWGCRGARWGHDGAIAAYNSTALNSTDGKEQAVILVNSLTLDDKVGDAKAQKALLRLFKTALCS
jgi:D-alanyl-D-alanine carboxypeptidase